MKAHVTTRQEPSQPPQTGWVLYDGSCGICKRIIYAWQRTFWRHGFRIAPLQEPWVGERLQLGPDEVVKEFRLLLADGRQFEGAEAYRELLRRVRWLYPAFLLASLPGLRAIFDAAYHWFAKNRFRFS
ncbi:MAG TPA: DUF393 domain-containing protein, partial [Clostridia bacterium]|nr:DUF393 domain-containing protein [Clostridia bacterium]